MQVLRGKELQGHETLNLGKHNHSNMRFEVLMVVKMSVFCVVTPCGLVVGLKMEAVCSSKMLVTTYKSTWCYYPEDKN
jgi:hypothetical protein